MDAVSRSLREEAEKGQMIYRYWEAVQRSSDASRSKANEAAAELATEKENHKRTQDHSLALNVLMASQLKQLQTALDACFEELKRVQQSIESAHPMVPHLKPGARIVYTDPQTARSDEASPTPRRGFVARTGHYVSLEFPGMPTVYRTVFVDDWHLIRADHQRWFNDKYPEDPLQTAPIKTQTTSINPHSVSQFVRWCSQRSGYWRTDALFVIGTMAFSLCLVLNETRRNPYYTG
jgi:hypothetical protein